jgi:hypothetical protein
MSTSTPRPSTRRTGRFIAVFRDRAGVWTVVDTHTSILITYFPTEHTAFGLAEILNGGER